MDPKPGPKTTEFWLTVAAVGISALASIGVITATDATTLQGAVATAITSIAAIIGSVYTIASYIQSRTTVKSGDMVLAAAIDPTTLDKARSAGVPWLTLLLWAIQYGPQLKELIDKLLADRRRQS